MIRRRRRVDHGVPVLLGKTLQNDVRKWSSLPISLVVALPLGANLAMLAMIAFHLRSVMWSWQDLTVVAMAVLGAIPLLMAIVLDLSARWNRARRRRKAKRLRIAVAERYRPATEYYWP